MRRKEFEGRNKRRDASRLTVCIAVSRFNEDITESMLLGAREVLAQWGVKNSRIHVTHTYGSFELPFACARLIKKHRPHAVIAIGCIIKGETRHDEYLAHATANGLMQLMLETGVPVGFGVITTQTLAQARARSRGVTNHGRSAAIAALESALA